MSGWPVPDKLHMLRTPQRFFTNSAGMSLLADLGGQMLYGNARYELSDDAALNGNSPGNVIGCVNRPVLVPCTF
ncbi:hypothetical protein GCM10007905_30360 [Mixta theicola]|nr:hypothetical protein GCM10007905_30360 [Mixta theicola]